jgi:hypothetical protein
MKKAILLFVLILLSDKILPQETLKVETDVCVLQLNKISGNLVGLHWNNPGEDIIKENRLGENFRILLPLKDYEANYFLSTNQKARIEPIKNGVICYYDQLINERQTVPVKVTYRIECINGKLEFSIKVDNPTMQPLAEVYYGIIGGQKGLRNRTDNLTMIPGGTWNNQGELFTNFSGGAYGGGNLGITYGAGGILYPGSMSMSWMEVYNLKENIGMYYAEHDTINRISYLYYELRPSEKGNVIGDNWPTEADVPKGEPIGLTMGWVKLPYTRQGIFESGTVVLKLHRGDWHEGSLIYREWFDRHFNVKRVPDWLRKEQAWLSIIISNSEDVIHYKFSDLPRLAAEAKKYGVTSFEILGWDKGGIDRGYPEYEPDIRLGSKQDFQNALTDIKKEGVHPIIFSNIQFTDTDIPLYHEKLEEYVRKGRWTDDLPMYGWGEGTISSRLGPTRHNMTLMTPSYPEVHKMLMKYYLDLVKSGANAFQFDKTCVLDMDFNPLNKLGPDRAMPQGVFDIFGEVLKEGKKIDPELSIASETIWDKCFQFVDVSYLRMNNIDMCPALRYTFPEWTSTIFAENPFDFNIMNNGMRYGLVWALAPRHYNSSMDDDVFKPLSEYVSELIRIRKKYEEILFLGVFNDTIGVHVNCGTNTRYSVFKNKAGTKQAVVLVNFDNKDDIIDLTIPGFDQKQFELLIPFRQDRILKKNEKIIVPARTCAVVAEEL